MKQYDLALHIRNNAKTTKTRSHLCTTWQSVCRSNI